MKESKYCDGKLIQEYFMLHKTCLFKQMKKGKNVT